ncbi:MAG: hypothetical protein ACYTEL_12380 [Planctomycetota bacterium]|jgi:hypothetical protein
MKIDKSGRWSDQSCLSAAALLNLLALVLIGSLITVFLRSFHRLAVVTVIAVAAIVTVTLIALMAARFAKSARPILVFAVIFSAVATVAVGLGFLAFMELGLLWPLPVFFYSILAFLISVPWIRLLLTQIRRSHALALGIVGAALVALIFTELAGGFMANVFFLIVFACFTVLMTPAVFTLLFSKLRRTALGLYLALMCATVVLCFVPWSSRHRFCRDLERIRRGMTVAHVEKIMAGYT